MSRKSYRERYFEDYAAKTVVTDGKTKTQYEYVGLWYAWGPEGFDRKKRGLLYLLLEAVSIVAYLVAALQPSAVNTQRLAAGFGILSLVPWLLELWSVVRFCTGKEYITALDFDEIHGRMRISSLLRALLLFLSLLCGTVGAVQSGALDGRGVLALCLGLVSCGCSLVINRLQKTIGYRTYHNDGGKVGTEC